MVAQKAELTKTISRETEDLINGLGKKYRGDVLKIIKGAHGKKIKFFQRHEDLCEAILALWSEEKKAHIVELLKTLFTEGMLAPVDENPLEILRENNVTFFNNLTGYDRKKKIIPQITSSLAKKSHEILGLKQQPSLKEIVNAYNQLMAQISEEDKDASEAKRILIESFLKQFIETSKVSSSQDIVDAVSDDDIVNQLAVRTQHSLRVALAIISHAKTIAASSELTKREKKIIADNPPAVSEVLQYVEEGGDFHKTLAGGTPLICYVAEKGKLQELQNFLGIEKKRREDGFQDNFVEHFNINEKNPAGHNALSLAILEGDKDKIIALLRAGASPNEIVTHNKKEISLVELAIEIQSNKSVQILVPLLQGGARVSPELREKLPKESLKLENDYDLGSEFLATQIIRRKKDPLPRILGLCEVAKVRGGISDAKNPFMVVMGYEKLIESLANRSGSINSAEAIEVKAILAKSFLALVAAVSDNYHLCPTNSFSELRKNYDKLKLRCEEAGKVIGDDSQDKRNLVRNAHKSMVQIFKTFKFNPTKHEEIDVKSYLEMMKLIPGGEADTAENQKEFRQARLDLSAAFISQFGEKTPQELLEIFQTKTHFSNFPKEIFAVGKLEVSHQAILDEILVAVGDGVQTKNDIQEASILGAKKFFGLEADASSESVFEAYKKAVKGLDDTFGFEDEITTDPKPSPDSIFGFDDGLIFDFKSHDQLRAALIASRAVASSDEEIELLKQAKEILEKVGIAVGSAVKLDARKTTQKQSP